MKTLFLLLALNGSAQAMTVPQAAIDLVKQYEGLRLNAYQDSVGYWTVGFGHKNMTPPPCENCTVVTAQQAESMLENDLEYVLSLIQGHISADLTDNQLAALLSFAFNLGAHSLINSTLLKELNAGNTESAAEQFDLWVHAGGVTLPGLVTRRNAEKTLFLTPDTEVTLASN
jgi:lysozyme